MKSNEAFSGGGHARHVCRDCQRLGPAVIAERQVYRDIDRCFTHEGTLRRRHRAALDRFRCDPRPGIQAYAEERIQEVEEERILEHAWHRYETAYFEALALSIQAGSPLTSLLSYLDPLSDPGLGMNQPLGTENER